MSDFDFDDLLAGAVEDYRELTVSQIKPAGTDIARSTAVHRKRVHTVSLAVLVSVLVIAPVTAYAATDHDRHAPPTIAGTPTGSPSIASAAPSTSPTTSTPPSISTSAASPPAHASTPGRSAPITQHELANATLQLPSNTWLTSFCPHGTVKLVNGHFTDRNDGGPEDGLLKVVTTDVDHDGNPDAVALFGCARSDPGFQSAVAFQRRSDGKIHTMGAVTTGIPMMPNIATAAGGSVRLQVSNLQGSDEGAVAAQIVQWRTYSWNGSRFRQTAGSTSFTTASQLTAQTSNLNFGAAVNGIRTGTMTVSIHNQGSRTVRTGSIVFNGGFIVEELPSDNPSCGTLPYAPDIPSSGVCAIGSVAAGKTVTVPIRFTANSGEVSELTTHPSLHEGGLLIQIRVGDQALVKQPTLGKAVFN